MTKFVILLLFKIIVMLVFFNKHVTKIHAECFATRKDVQCH